MSVYFLSSLHFCFLHNSTYLTFARSLFMIADHYSQARILTYNQCHSGRQCKRSMHRNDIAPFGFDLTSQKHAFPLKHDPTTSLSYTTKRIQDVLYKHYFRQICYYNERTNSLQLKWEIFCTVVNDNCFQFSFTAVCLVLTERILFNSFFIYSSFFNNYCNSDVLPTSDVYASKHKTNCFLFSLSFSGLFPW